MSDNRDSQLPDLRYVRELAKVFRTYGLDEIEIETGEARILLRRGDAPSGGLAPIAQPAVAPPSPAPAETPAPSSAEAEGDYITSPFVGTFFLSARPDAEPFVSVGGSVQSGDTVCIVEAMKLFNEIEAEYACTIEEILVQNGEPVEFGARLFRVKRR
jgi:acetyl-CoA carboxylase biotin carboxyl carrier protein